MSASQLAAITRVAEQYDHGYIHLTSRQGIEIPFIRLEDIDEVKKALAEDGVRVRQEKLNEALKQAFEAK